MANERAAQLLLRIKTNKQDTQAAKQDLAAVRAEMDKFTQVQSAQDAALLKQVQAIQQQKIAQELAARSTRDAAAGQQSAAVATRETTEAIREQGRVTREVASEIQRLPKLQEDAQVGGRSRLRSFGRAARVNLPAVPIGGFSTEQIARLVEGVGAAEEGIGRLNPKMKLLAAGAIGAAIAIATLIINMASQARAAREAADAALTGAKEYFELIHNENSESIRALQQENETRVTIARRNFEFQQAILEGLQEQIQQQGVLAQITSEAGVITGLSAQELAAAREAAAAAFKELIAANIEADNLSRALDDPLVKMRELAEAAERQAAAHQEDFDNRQRQRLDVIRSFASSDDLEALEERIAALQAEKDAIGEFLQQEEVGIELHQELTQAYLDLGGEISILENLIRDEVAARDEERRAIEYANQQREDSIAAIEDFNADVLKIQENRAKKEADIYGKLNDDIIRIAEQAAEAAERALEKLQQRRDDLALGLSRDDRDARRKAEFDQLQDQIKFQEDEAKSFRDHQRKLRDIRERSQEQEFGLIRDRNFSGLRDLRARTNSDLNRENRAFIEQGRERERAFALQQQDEARRREFERQSRIQRFNDAIADAEAQARRELQQAARNRAEQEQRARTAAQRDIQLLVAKTNQELLLRRNAISAELTMINQGYQARLQQDAAYVNALLAQGKLLQQGGLFGLLGQAVGDSISNSRTLSNNQSVTFNGSNLNVAQVAQIATRIFAQGFAQFAKQ